MLYQRKEGTIKINNTTMDYIAFGKGTKPFIMLPGLSFNRVKGSSLLISSMYRIFARDFRVYMFDRIEDVPEGYTVKDIARDTAYAMNQLGIKNAHILGVSQGGMIAQQIAIDYPELVDKMVLAVTLSKPNPVLEDCVGGWIQMISNGRMEDFTRDMFVKMYSEGYLKKYNFMVPLAVKLYRPKGRERFIILAKAAAECNLYDKLEKITCPVFVIGAKKDKVATGEASEEIADKLQCDIYMYDDMGHGVYQEMEKDFNQRIYDFLIK